jgi:hypothetical protein
MIIGVSELQKKISLFKNLTETVYIVDKKSKDILATVLPKGKIPNESLEESLGGIFKNVISSKNFDSYEEMKKFAYDEEMMAKYGK